MTGMILKMSAIFYDMIWLEEKALPLMAGNIRK